MTCIYTFLVIYFLCISNHLACGMTDPFLDPPDLRYALFCPGSLVISVGRALLRMAAKCAVHKSSLAGATSNLAAATLVSCPTHFPGGSDHFPPPQPTWTFPIVVRHGLWALCSKTVPSCVSAFCSLIVGLCECIARHFISIPTIHSDCIDLAIY